MKLPETSSELAQFEIAQSNFTNELTTNDLDPHAILQKVKKEREGKPTRIDFLRRTVLAAEIAFQLKEDDSLGHLKLQKLLFLCQHTCSMLLHTIFLKQAMGPYDPVLMRSLDNQFKKREWFQYNPKGFRKYLSLNNCGDHKEWYLRYFEEEVDNINYVIGLLKKANMDQAELVGTTFACWLNGINNNSVISDEFLIQKVYDWHETKAEKFTREQITKAIKWMNEKGLHPIRKRL